MKEQKGKKQKTYISIRLNIMFLCIFVLFSAIIMQLGKVQIVEGEAYKNQVESSQNETTSIPVPRGQILDREGKAVVNNKSLRTITYTRVKGITSEDILKTAKGLTDAEISRKIYVSSRRISTIINHIKEKWHINSRVELGILVYHYGFIDAPLFPNKESNLFERVAQ